MQQVRFLLAAIILSAAGVSVSARADLIPGGWLQPPRIPDPPPAEAAPPPAEPAVADPVLVAPPRPADEPAAVQPLPAPKVPRPVVHRHPAPARPPSDGKVQF
jgi:hypothetical protein